MPPVPTDILDAKRQLVSDNNWLWQLTISLRQSDEIIERGLRCCKESEKLLHDLDNQGHLRQPFCTSLRMTQSPRCFQEEGLRFTPRV